MLKNELNKKTETIKLKECLLSQKEEEIKDVNKILEKQREKNDLQRVLSEWKFKRLENEKEVCRFKIIFLIMLCHLEIPLEFNRDTCCLYFKKYSDKLFLINLCFTARVILLTRVKNYIMNLT